MPVETAADRAIMLADFGESVTFMPRIGSEAAITAIFDNQYDAVDAGGSVEFASVLPRLTVRTSDIPNAADGDTFLVRNIWYTARIVMDDGTGITEIALEAQ